MVAKSSRIPRIAFALTVAVVALYLVVSAFEPFRTNWGDPWSDGNAMTSGRYFARDGFIKTAMTPVLDVGPLEADSLRYTHYPPLPDLVAGVVQSVVGSGVLSVHRLVALLLTGLAMLFLFRYVESMWGRDVAFVSIATFLTNVLFLQYADTIHHIPIYWVTGFGCLLAALRWLDTGQKRYLAAVMVCEFLCFLASYDFFFFVPILLLSTIWQRGHKLFSRRSLIVVFLFGMAGIASIVTKNLLVIWAVGKHEWLKDIMFQFFERATDTHARPYKSLLGIMVFWRLWRFFTPIFYAGIIVQLVGIADRLRGRTADIPLQPLVLLVAAIPFMLVFTQLVVEQYHPLLLLLPFAAVNTGVLVTYVYKRSRVLAALIMVVYVGWQGFQLRHFPKAFLKTADVAAVDKALERDHHRFLMSNILVDGPVRYLWNRHLFGIEQDIDNLTIGLRERFEVFGKDSAITIVQLKNVAKHMYDKGVYPYFAGENRWPILARPDYYRNTVATRFKLMDKSWDKALEGVGTVVHDSPDMRVRSVTVADLDRFQLEHMPKRLPTAIDFADVTSEIFKYEGFSSRVGASELPGFAYLKARQPAKLLFTLQGYEWERTAPIHLTSTLRIPMQTRPTRLTLKLSTSLPVQLLSVSFNGHLLAKDIPLSEFTGVRTVQVNVPAELFQAGLQELSFGYAYERNEIAARLHKIDIE